MDNLLPALGVDFGGVIHGVTYRLGGPDTFLEGSLEEALATPAMPGAMEALARLGMLFKGRLWVVSKCGPRIQDRTEKWLDHNDFYAQTGFERSHLNFCRQRPDKAPRCAELGITHFIDDRADILESMEGIVEHRFLFASRGDEAPTGAHYAEDWPTVEAQIVATLRAQEVRGS
jgi:hypothetical protein